MKGFRFLLLVMAICHASGVKAQFYDGSDDNYYLVESINEISVNRENADIYIFNFDGKKHVNWLKKSKKGSRAFMRESRLL